MSKVSSICIGCLKVFEFYPSEKRIYCSDACSRAARVGKGWNTSLAEVDCNCLQCGNQFHLKPYQLDRNRGKFCSKECYWKHKAGKVTGCAAACTYWNGYRFIKRPEDNKRVPEHRDVMERHLGRKIESWEHIHHKNHDRSENRIENLEVLSASDHMVHHLNELTTEDLRKRTMAGGIARKIAVQNILRPRNDIIRSRRAGGESAASIASDFGITPSMVRAIVRASTSS